MNEEEWQTCADPTPMLEFLKGKVSARKLRLFAVTCCRSIWDLLPGDEEHRGVEAAERAADDPLAIRECDDLGEILQDNYLAAEGTPEANLIAAVAAAVQRDAVVAAKHAAEGAADAAAEIRGNTAAKKMLRNQSVALRDIFGNPFRTMTADSAWLTSDVVALAEGIYQERAFDRLPILADALMDAGCDHEDMLNHCRSNGPHVRGCWVVDLILGKE